MTYEEYKDYLRSEGWKYKLVTLNQDDEDKICESIQIFGFEKDDNLAFNIKFPDNVRITIDKNYTFKLNILDETGSEIPDNTKIFIEKIIPSCNIVTLAKIFYSDIKNGYKFDKFIEIIDWYHLIVYVIKQPSIIPKENIKFEFTFDYWTKET